MKINRNQKSHEWVAAFLLLILLLLQSLLFASQAEAQITRSFTSRFSTNANGDIRLIGNTVVTCSTTTGGNAASCAGAKSASNPVLNNDGDFDIIHVDKDSDPTTFNSTQSTLSLPVGSTVLFAGLYWGGRTNKAARNQVLLRTPVAGGYSTITASTIDTAAGASNNYAGFANVTAQVIAGGNGTYTVANV